MGREQSDCPGCGLRLPASDGPVHPYIGASAACWELYGQLLARELADPAYSAVHQLTVDAYAVQHPRRPERRSIQSVGVHLMALCLFLEQGVAPVHLPKLRARMLARRPAFHWLEPPLPSGWLTVADVLAASGAAVHVDRVEPWARSVWGAWAPHHATIREWIATSLTADDVRRPHGDPADP